MSEEKKQQVETPQPQKGGPVLNEEKPNLTIKPPKYTTVDKAQKPGSLNKIPEDNMNKVMKNEWGNEANKIFW